MRKILSCFKICRTFSTPYSTHPQKNDDINVDFLNGLGYENNNLGLTSISVNSSKFELAISYSNKLSVIAPILNSNINNAKDIPNIYYKK